MVTGRQKRCVQSQSAPVTILHHTRSIHPRLREEHDVPRHLVDVARGGLYIWSLYIELDVVRRVVERDVGLAASVAGAAATAAVVPVRGAPHDGVVVRVHPPPCRRRSSR